MPKAKNKDGQMPDVNATRFCEICNVVVKIGLGGEKNWEGHTNSRNHLKKAARANSGTSKLKSTQITRFWSVKEPKKPSSPDRSSSNQQSVTEPELTRQPSPEPIDIDCLPDPPSSAVCDKDTPSLLQQLSQLASTLPSTIPLAGPDDILAQFASDPRDSVLPGEDPYETVIDRALSNSIGYNKDAVEVAQIIRRGALGIDGFCEWVRICVEEMKIAVPLLEIRVNRVCEAMKIMGASENIVRASTLPEVQSLSPSEIETVLEQRSQIRCKGQRLDIGDRSPWLSYPFGLHPHQDLTWNVFVSNDGLFVCSKDCSGHVYNGDSACDTCKSLLKLDTLQGILERIGSSPRDGTTWNYYTFDNLISHLTQKNQQINGLKLHQLNTERSLLVRNRNLEAHKRFLFAVAKGDVPRLHSLVTTQLKNGGSIFAVLDKISKACTQVYHPKDYSDADYQQLFLFHKLGGVAVAELAHRTRGLPSIDATRHYIKPQRLTPSPKMPTSVEMSSNLEISYPSSSTPSPATRKVGFQLMADEIKIESRMRWNARTNMILGICREHSADYSLEFRTVAQPEAIVHGIRDQKLHFASEATVLAVSHFSDAPRAYSAHPFVVSGSCKREGVQSQRDLLETACQTLTDKQGNIGGRLYCITSDGDSRRRRATALITLTRTLDISDPLRQQLGKLRLFNFKCGFDDRTGDIEYKHLLKRSRNSLIRSAGATIDGNLINSSILRNHLLSTGMDTQRINAIVSPNDKQDVKLAYDLLSSIAVLLPAQDGDPPAVHNTRNSLRLLGKVYTHLLEAYTNINLDLHDQLQHLSSAAHLIMAIYSFDKGSSMPSQTYFDWMTTIKNVYFCVAKTQIDDEEGKFWIILVGTDPLERVFGMVRIMHGADANADQQQLNDRVESGAVCSRILAENPSWDRSARRLTLKTWRDEAGDISAKVDHINPASWKGNVKVKDVVLLTCWEEGRRVAIEELKSHGYPSPFDKMDKGEGFDMLCLFGNHKMVLLDGLTDGEREEDDEEIEMATTSTASNESAGTHSQPPDDSTNVTSDDLEDLANNELSQLTGDKTPKYDPYITVTTLSGKSVKQHKSSACRFFSDPHRDSTSRLDRIRAFSRYDEPSNHSFQYSEDGESEPLTRLEDPAALLVRSKELIWLAAVQIYGIKQNGVFIDYIPTRLITEPHIRLQLKVYRLKARASPDEKGDWEWFGGFEKGTVEVEGRYIQLLNPETIYTTIEERMNAPGYAFNSSELVALACMMYGNLRSETDRLPTISWSDTFPHQMNNDSLCFICEDDTSLSGTIQMQHRCPLCPTLSLTVKPAAKLVHHMATHILFDPVVRARRSPCGFCCGAGDTGLCTIYLIKGKGRNGVYSIDLDRSHCKNGNIVKLSLASRQESTECTNAPLICPLCPSGAPAVWKYNLLCHIQDVHPTANQEAQEYKSLYEIERAEHQALKKSRLKKTRVTANKLGKLGELKISSSHSARLAVSIPSVQTNTNISDIPDNNDDNSLSEPVASRPRTRRRMLISDDESDSAVEGSINQDHEVVSELESLATDVPLTDDASSADESLGNSPEPYSDPKNHDEPTDDHPTFPQLDGNLEIPSSSGRPKRLRKARSIGIEIDTFGCAEIDCEDELAVEEMVVCTECGLKYHLSCQGLRSQPPALSWFCDDECKRNAGKIVRANKRLRKV